MAIAGGGRRRGEGVGAVREDEGADAAHRRQDQHLPQGLLPHRVRAGKKEEKSPSVGSVPSAPTRFFGFFFSILPL